MLAGAFAIVQYGAWLESSEPYLYSVASDCPQSIMWLGALAWVALLVAVTRICVRKRS